MQVWLNDRLLPAEEARISPFDRGFLFGDGMQMPLTGIITGAGKQAVTTRSC